MNKDNERKALSVIFSEDKYIIEDSESPDFILITKKNYFIEESFKFGVEVTDYYRDGVNARLINRPHYFEALTNPNCMRYGNINKGDARKVTIDTISFLPDKNKDILSNKEFKAVIQEVAKPNELGDGISARIIDKESKLINYKCKIEDNYLIIYDYEGCLYGEDKKYLFNAIYSEKLLKTLSESKFREIFLITNHNNKEIYFSLIERFLGETIYDFIAKSNKNDFNFGEKIKYVIDGVLNSGFKVHWCYDKSNNDYKIIYHDCVFVFRNNNQDMIFDGVLKTPLPIGVPIDRYIII